MTTETRKTLLDLIRAKPPTSHRRHPPHYVCSACRMAFEDLPRFARHLDQGRCLSPAELQAQKAPMTIKNGIWVKDTSQWHHTNENA